MQSLLFRASLVSVFLGLCCSCAVRSRDAVRYAGPIESQLVHPDQVTEVPALPPGYTELGAVDTRCEMTQRRELSRVWLSDVDCTEERLTTALREQVADAGGSILVGRHCFSLTGARGVEVVCRASVGRPDPHTSGLEYPEGGEVEPRASEGWSIRVQYTPESDEVRPPRAPGNVQELPTRPLSHIAMGSVITGCDTGCTEAGARAGLLAVAGRMGAGAVSEAQCVRRKLGWVCSGKASAYEVDPEQHPEAR